MIHKVHVFSVSKPLSNAQESVVEQEPGAVRFSRDSCRARTRCYQILER